MNVQYGMSFWWYLGDISTATFLSTFLWFITV